MWGSRKTSCDGLANKKTGLNNLYFCIKEPVNEGSKISSKSILSLHLKVVEPYPTGPWQSCHLSRKTHLKEEFKLSCCRYTIQCKLSFLKNIICNFVQSLELTAPVSHFIPKIGCLSFVWWCKLTVMLIFKGILSLFDWPSIWQV